MSTLPRLLGSHVLTALVAGSASAATTKYYFGRLVAEGQRSLVGSLDLKKRNYIGAPRQTLHNQHPPTLQYPELASTSTRTIW